MVSQYHGITPGCLWHAQKLVVCTYVVLSAVTFVSFELGQFSKLSLDTSSGCQVPQGYTVMRSNGLTFSRTGRDECDCPIA